jgi:predicted AAA+ superfamily ATPase
MSLDDFMFETNDLIKIIEDLYKQGYRRFYFDEIHRYPEWSRILKQVYDDYNDVYIMATGSSILDINKGNADLSRRAVIYNIQGLSFREYLMLEKNIYTSSIKLEDIVNNHQAISSELLETFSWEDDFHNYLKFGYYPFFKESKKNYSGKLEQTAHLIIENDITAFENLNYKTIHSLKKLLFVISQSVPFIPNVSKLSKNLDIPRNTLLRLLSLLDQAKLIKLLHSGTKGISYLQKPDKIYLENTNLMYMFSEGKPNIGSIRETFFLNQVSYLHSTTSSKFGDFMIDEEFTFEVGGSTKGLKQIKGVPLSYLALDIKAGSGKNIPLWLFGFLS